MRLSPLLLALSFACGGGQGARSPGSPVDADGDGFDSREDCNDGNNLVFPGAEDGFGDGVDNNCDGVDGVDGDGDGQAGVDSGGLDCDDADPNVQGTDGDGDGAPSCIDCDDTDRTISPWVDELCDGLDDDCDGRVDQAADDLGACSQEFLASNRLDLLFVVDNSCSMGQEQIDLAQATDVLTAELLYSGVDYHLGVVSTDMSDFSHSGKLRQAGGVRWIEPTSPNATLLLESMIEMGTGGSATEKGLDATYAALRTHAGPGEYNEGFRRMDADLGVVFVSDESDYSHVYSLPIDLETALEPVVDFGYHARLHAIVSPNPICPTASTPGSTYEQLALDTGGVIANICFDDWGQFLAEIANTHEPHHLGVYWLGFDIVPDSIAVDVTTPTGTDRIQPPDVTWDADAQTVHLSVPPPLDAEITVWYTPAP